MKNLSFTAAWMPHSNNVVFYDHAGKDIGVMKWPGKEVSVVTGAKPHARLGEVAAAYCFGRTEPANVVIILKPGLGAGGYVAGPAAPSSLAPLPPVKVPALKSGNQAEVAAKFLALFNDAQAVLPRVVAFGVYAHHHKQTELKRGQFLPWLRSICPADRPPESFIRCVQSHLCLTESVLKAAGIQIRNAFRITHGGEIFLLPAADVPAAAKPVREKVFNIIDGKSARQLFAEFKQADDEEESPKPKRGRLKGHGGASKEQRLAAQAAEEKARITEMVLTLKDYNKIMDELSDANGIPKVPDRDFLTHFERLEAYYHFCRNLKQARKNQS